MSLARQSDKNVGALLNLMKRDSNSKCFDCQTRIPCYVNLTTTSFVCMLCSGLLKELGHQIKSVSFSNFTADEVNRMETGGNEEAAKVWLNNWNQNRGTRSPILQDITSIKAHLREKYVIKRWYREGFTSKTHSLSTSTLTPRDTSVSSHSNPRAAPYLAGVKKPLQREKVVPATNEDVLFVKTLPRPKKPSDVSRSFTTSFVDDFSNLSIQQKTRGPVHDKPLTSQSFDYFPPLTRRTPVSTQSKPIHSNSNSGFVDLFADFDQFNNSSSSLSPPSQFYQTHEPPLTHSAPQITLPPSSSPSNLPNPTRPPPHHRLSCLLPANSQDLFATNPFAEEVFGTTTTVTTTRTPHHLASSPVSHPSAPTPTTTVASHQPPAPANWVAFS